jgi:hypothetical protein
VEAREEVRRNRREKGWHLEVEEGLRHLRLVYQEEVRGEAKRDQAQGQEVAEPARHQRMPDRHPKNRAGGILEGRRREQEVLQVVPRGQENPKVLREGDQRFRERNRYLEKESREGYCQEVAVEEVREEVLNQVEEA